MDLQRILEEVDTWPADDRLRLIEAVWDRLNQESEDDRLTESQQADLKRRLDAYRGDPGSGSPWQEVKARLRGSAR